MKLFIAIIVVFFIIIGAYYTADGLSQLFGYGHFKLTKPGPNAATLKNVGVKNLTSFKVSEATYSDCIGNCTNGNLKMWKFSNCNAFCLYVCNQTSDKKCIAISGELRIGTISGKVDFNFYRVGYKDVHHVAEIEYNDFPQMSIITKNYLFFLPKCKSNSLSNYQTQFNWSIDGKKGGFDLDKAPICEYALKGESCNTSEECSVIVSSGFHTDKSSTLSKSGQVIVKGLSDCLSMILNITNDKCDKVDFVEYENGIQLTGFTIDSNSTYDLSCPRHFNNVTLYFNLPEGCSLHYEVSHSTGLTTDNNIDCGAPKLKCNNKDCCGNQTICIDKSEECSGLQSCKDVCGESS